jgi:hypothetical protein
MTMAVEKPDRLLRARHSRGASLPTQKKIAPREWRAPSQELKA